MSFETKVIYATDSHFTNPTTVAESGTPSSVTLQQLTPNQQYYTKAQIWNDGSMDDESSTENFTTIPAGTITLTYIQTVRSGYGYDVSYSYTSTYAPSYATLSTNGSTFQGFIDSAQNVVSFWVTGLTSGEAYLTSVTLGDIYGETETVTGSIVTTVVNEVHITGTEPSETSIDVDIAYVLDGGFWQGYVDYWLASQDPETEPSQGHEYFTDGTDTVTMSGLSPETAYKFRVTITLSDMTTEIESNMVTASTLIDYSLKYFTIKNESNSNNTISMIGGSSSMQNININVSTDNGTTWTQKYVQATGTTLATLRKGESVILVNNGGSINQTIDNLTYGYQIQSTGRISVFGNIGTFLNYGFNNFSLRRCSFLFSNNTNLISAENLSFKKVTGISNNALQGFFSGCTNLEKAPILPEISALAKYCYQNMFSGCTSLTNLPDLIATTLAEGCYFSMFSGCTRINGEPYLPATTLASYCYKYMFTGCANIRSVTVGARSWNTNYSDSWLWGVSASGTFTKPSGTAIPEGTSGIPSGWTVVNV